MTACSFSLMWDPIVDEGSSSIDWTFYIGTIEKPIRIYSLFTDNVDEIHNNFVSDRYIRIGFSIVRII